MDFLTHEQGGCTVYAAAITFISSGATRRVVDGFSPRELVMHSRKLAFIALVIALLGCMRSATAAPCTTASLSAYQVIGTSGCTVGSLTLSNFFIDAFPGVTATQIAPASVLVTPLAGGFQLSSGTVLSASANELLGLRFLFDASAMSLAGATVALGGQNSVSGDGVITAILDAGPAGVASHAGRNLSGTRMWRPGPALRPGPYGKPGAGVGVDHLRRWPGCPRTRHGSARAGWFAGYFC